MRLGRVLARYAVLNDDDHHKDVRASNKRSYFIDMIHFGFDDKLLLRIVHSYDETGSRTGTVTYGADGVRIPDS